MTNPQKKILKLKKTRKKGSGGYRPNAGRKKAKDRKVKIIVTVWESKIKSIFGGDEVRAKEVIQDAIDTQI